MQNTFPPQLFSWQQCPLFVPMLLWNYFNSDWTVTAAISFGNVWDFRTIGRFPKLQDSRPPPKPLWPRHARVEGLSIRGRHYTSNIKVEGHTLTLPTCYHLLLQSHSCLYLFPKCLTLTDFTTTQKKNWNSTNSAVLHLPELGPMCRKESRALRCCKYASSWAPSTRKSDKALRKGCIVIGTVATCMPRHLRQFNKMMKMIVPTPSYTYLHEIDIVFSWTSSPLARKPNGPAPFEM